MYVPGLDLPQVFGDQGEEATEAETESGEEAAAAAAVINAPVLSHTILKNTRKRTNPRVYRHEHFPHP